MIKALLGKIEGLFDKDFLFASFLPSLVFLAGIAATLVAVVGFDSTLAWIEAWTAIQKATITTVAGVGVVVFAYILHGLRTVFLRLWSGMIGRIVFLPGQEFNRWRYLKLKKRAFRPRKWDGIFEWFRSQVGPVWDPNRPDIPPEERDELMRTVEAMHEGMSVTALERLLTRSVIAAYGRYSGDGLLRNVYKAVREKLEDWQKREEVDIGTKRAKLDRQFGTPESIRATALGNVVESYNVYPFKRYGMEGEVFWAHLQHVIKPEFLARIREVRILLDFCLTMATLGTLFGVLAAIVGPWLWFSKAFWLSIAAVALLVSYGIYYRMAVFVATQYGDLVRAGFDLFRLDLLHALYRQHPATRSLELQMWEQLSQLVVFGQVQDFEIRPRQP